MDDIFHSARLTLGRAQHHIRDFKEIISDFHNTQPWSYVVDKESQPEEHIHKIQFTTPIPETLPCVLFDAVNNLRAVLDQIGYASAMVSGNKTKKTNFPFGDDAQSVENCINGRCKDIPSEIVTLFRGFKPYKGGNNTLWALNKLCNAKKHCTLVPLVVTSAKAEFSARLPPGHVVGSGLPGSSWNPDRKELILTIVPVNLDPYISGSFTFDLAITGIEMLGDKPAIGDLNSMMGVVERILRETETECRRLRFIP